jgi:hypothetical protein
MPFRLARHLRIVPEVNGPVSRMTRYPDRLTCSWPSAKVDIMCGPAALGVRAVPNPRQ